MRELGPKRRGKVWIPARVRDHQGAEGQERRQDFEDLEVAAGFDVRPQEILEHPTERFGHTALASLGGLAHPEEQIVDSEGGDIVGRLAPLAATAIEYAEVDTLPEEDIPWVKVAVRP